MTKFVLGNDQKHSFSLSVTTLLIFYFQEQICELMIKLKYQCYGMNTNIFCTLYTFITYTHLIKYLIFSIYYEILSKCI